MMIDETILHYPPKADEPLVHKILEKLGEVLLRLGLHTETDKTKVCFVGHVRLYNLKGVINE